MSENVVFSKAEFLTELGRFRELFGDRRFWAKTEDERQQAIKGLMHVYFNIDPKIDVEKEHIAAGLHAALFEYGKRMELLIKHNLPIGI